MEESLRLLANIKQNTKSLKATWESQERLRSRQLEDERKRNIFSDSF